MTDRCRPSMHRIALLAAAGAEPVIAPNAAYLHLLHDSRARNVAEAILWHGGEAQPARDALIAFRNSL